MGTRSALTDVDFSTDGEHVVTSSGDGTARVLMSDSGAPLLLLTGNKDWVTSAAFSGAAGSSVVTASADGTARVWDATFQPELEELAALRAPVVSSTWTTTVGVRAEVRGRNGRTCSTRTPASEIEVERGTRSRQQGRGRERDDGDDSRQHGRPSRSGRPHDDARRATGIDVKSVSFSPDGSLLVTASRDHDARIWDVETG